MTNDIIEIAKQSGFKVHPSGLVTVGSNADWDKLGPMLTKFAELIQARAVPDGYVVVPVEPTAVMIKAGLRWMTGFQHMRATDKQNAFDEAYRAMIAAAQKGSV